MGNMDNEDRIQLVPAKRFFVEMLTRDIELVDAILDLIDNCLDGAMRMLNGNISTEKPYNGYQVDISFDENHFQISDNCGGIPRDVAINSAFRMGRHDRERDQNIPTLGVYGIGMKRAIFKIGEDATVECNTADEHYKVEITKEWMQDDASWHLPLMDVEGNGKPNGTYIRINEIREGIKLQFADQQNFHKELFDIISTHFSYIIMKGLEIKINGEIVSPDISIIRFTKDFSNLNESVAPYIYTNTIDGVDVDVTVGFYRSLGTDKEEQDEKDGKSLSERAGLTIICNDRVVLHNDKTHITGWGEAGVPNYHTQFIGISGVVVFRSNDAAKLPLKTTKRGVDSSLKIYALTKDRMREGLKIFTSFTNKWKKAPRSELSKHFLIDQTESAPTVTISKKVKDEEWSNVRRGGGKVFKPKLPLPNEEEPTARIIFTKKKSEINAVSEYLFDEERPASEVGEYCFNQYLKKV